MGEYDGHVHRYHRVQAGCGKIGCDGAFELAEGIGCDLGADPTQFEDQAGRPELSAPIAAYVDTAP